MARDENEISNFVGKRTYGFTLNPLNEDNMRHVDILIMRPRARQANNVICL